MQNTRESLIGNIHALYYSNLFSELGVPQPNRKHYKPVSLVIGFKDVDPEGMQDLESRLGHYFGKDIAERVLSVPGLSMRKTFTRNETDYKVESANYQYPLRPDAVTTDVILDVWQQTENAGQCPYIAGASKFYTEIEGWNSPSSPDNRHATLYVTSRMQFREFDRTPESRRKLLAFMDSLPSTMSDEDVMRKVAEQDTPHIEVMHLLRKKDSTFLIKKFLPGYEIVSLGGFPELVHKLE